jgi:hypothetical protein
VKRKATPEVVKESSHAPHALLPFSSTSMPHGRESDPIPTTNMASNGKIHLSERKRVLIVGAGAAGMYLGTVGEIYFDGFL